MSISSATMKALFDAGATPDMIVRAAEEAEAAEAARREYRQRFERMRHTKAFYVARHQTFATHGLRCFYCGSAGGEFALEIDHVVPLCRGGANDASNMVPSCKPCNSRKRHRTADEWSRS